MSLAIGARLGPYEILGALGAGGMGEVYKARDTRLDRTVAIKIISGFLADAPELRERFDREARAISRLNHPNVCTLYDIGHENSTDFLVMEYLEGETLSARLARGAMPVQQALDCAVQIVEALCAAHRAGVLHRDLKPANIVLTKSGAKLLDFGLAKRADPAAAARSFSSQSPASPAPSPPTMTTPLTAQGTILGTFQYMAPEQIEGAEADARTDIFAFGCVLYEMLTGHKAFEGRSAASLVAAILEREPKRVTDLQPLTPPALEHVVNTCLAKNPDERFHTAHDLLLQLKWIAKGGSAAGVPAPVIARRRRRDRGVTAALAVGLALIAGLGAWFLKPAPEAPRPVTRFIHTLANGQDFTRGGRPLIAISPDGTRIVFVADKRLYLRSLDLVDAQPIRGTEEDPSNPFFSPDGQWIGYWAGEQLKKIPVSGGAPSVLCAAGNPFGASWTPGTIVFGQQQGIVSVPDTGGTPRLLARVEPKGTPFHGPQLVNGGTHLLYTFRRRADEDWSSAQIVLKALDTGQQTVLVERGTDGRILPTGHLVYIADSTIFALPFDRDRLNVIGGPVAVVESVAHSGPQTGAGQFSVSDTGTLVYRTGADADLSTLTWVDRKGAEQALPAPARSYGTVRVSPDGKVIVAAIRETSVDLWTWNIERTGLSKLTFDPGNEVGPVWSRDSQRILYTSESDGGRIFSILANGTGKKELFAEVSQAEDVRSFPLSLSTDGGWLLFLTATIGGTPDLFALPLTGDRRPRPIAITTFVEAGGTFSPDGRWLAYQSNESGQSEVYVRPFPNIDAGKWLVSAGGGTRPLWSPTRRELFYHADNHIYAVPINAGSSFSWSAPQRLFDTSPYRILSPGRSYDIAPDGRFLFPKPTTSSEPPRLVVVENWFSELRTRVPVSR